MNSRDKAIAALKEMIRNHRAQISPAVLERAQKAAEQSGGLATGTARNDSKTVPYDRKAAQKAIELFLQAHPDQKDFTARLMTLMKKTLN